MASESPAFDIPPELQGLKGVLDNALAASKSATADRELFEEKVRRASDDLSRTSIRAAGNGMPSCDSRRMPFRNPGHACRLSTSDLLALNPGPLESSVRVLKQFATLQHHALAIILVNWRRLSLSQLHSVNDLHTCLSTGATPR